MAYTICTDKGNIKKINQDSALYKEADTDMGKIILAAVCDGMGGLSNGEVASSMMTKALSQWFDTSFPVLCREGLTDNTLKKSLNRLIIQEDERITRYGEKNGDCGTTLAAVIAGNGMYICVNVGDSRVYRITKDVILQLTHDQTAVQQLIDAKRITEEQAKAHPDKNKLLQCVGAGGDVSPAYSLGEYSKGDIFLVCSDGFRHKLSEKEMKGVFNRVKNDDDLSKAARMCVDAIKKRKERDNITVIIVTTK